MSDNPRNFCGTGRAYFPIYPFEKIKATAPELPSPAFISDAVLPEVLTSER
jgi:hypothetical protein